MKILMGGNAFQKGVKISMSFLAFCNCKLPKLRKSQSPISRFFLKKSQAIEKNKAAKLVLIMLVILMHQVKMTFNFFPIPVAKIDRIAE